MLAIFNSRCGAVARKPRFRFAYWVAAFFIALLILNPAAKAAENSPSLLADKAEFARRAEKAYLAAKSRFESATNDSEAAWQFGRACYDWADVATSDDKREEISQQGIDACRALINREASSVPGHYYLAMNLGERAQTKTLGALKIVTQMESEFKITLGLDPNYDLGGADRGLGLLYRDAPGWPISLGSKSKARQHLQQALKLSSDYPENLLNVIEAELKWGDKSAAITDLKTLDDLWPKAKTKFTGEPWESSWVDWEQRRDAAQKKIGQPSRLAEPPKKNN